MLDRGDLDISLMMKSPERLKKYIFTRPIAKFPYVIVVRQSFEKQELSLSEMNGLKIAIRQKFLIEKYLRKNYSKLQLHTTIDDLTGLLAVSTGQYDAYIGNLAYVTFLIDKEKIPNLRIAGVTPFLNKISYSTRKDNTILRDILDKGLGRITEEERQRIFKRYIRIDMPAAVLSKKGLYTIFTIISFILITTLAILAWNRSLRKRVQIKTGELHRELEERKKMQEEMVRLVTAIEQSDEAIIITGVDGEIQYVNPSFEKITGWSKDEVIEKNPNILKSGKHDNAFYKKLWKTITEGDIWHGHFINKRKDGTIYDEDATISPVRDSAGKITNFVAVKRDITGRLKLEKQLRQAQKMESLGTLAGGIAHDFNNILSAVMGYTQISLREVEKESKLEKWLENVMEASIRAKDLVQQILQFSRMTEKEKTVLHLIPLVKETLKFIRASIPTSIKISQKVNTEKDLIKSDPTQVHQIIMNLCTNAGHAMKNTGGELEVTVENILIESPDHALDLIPGEYVLLSVRDTGCGISNDIIDRIFDPYFTTREMGEGTGLGLSVILGIVRDNNGNISVYSEEGKGTVFHVYLPLVKTEEAAAPEEEPEYYAGGSEGILFVDDEKFLADLGREMLEPLGYTVRACSGGKKPWKSFVMTRMHMIL